MLSAGREGLATAQRKIDLAQELIDASADVLRGTFRRKVH